MPNNSVYLRINATLLSLYRVWAECGVWWERGGHVGRAAVACVEQWTIHKPKVKRLKIIEQHQKRHCLSAFGPPNAKPNEMSCA